MMDSDIKSCLESVDWCRADYEYFRGGVFRRTSKRWQRCL